MLVAYFSGIEEPCAHDASCEASATTTSPCLSTSYTIFITTFKFSSNTPVVSFYVSINSFGVIILMTSSE